MRFCPSSYSGVLMIVFIEVISHAVEIDHKLVTKKIYQVIELGGLENNRARNLAYLKNTKILMYWHYDYLPSPPKF